MSSSINVLTNSPKDSDMTKGDFFKLEVSQNNEKMR